MISYVYDNCILVSPGNINIWKLGPATAEPVVVVGVALSGNDAILTEYSVSSKYTTLPTFNPSMNSLFESNKTVDPCTAINDDAVTFPAAVKWNPLEEICKFPADPDINWVARSPRKNVFVWTSRLESAVEYRK